MRLMLVCVALVVISGCGPKLPPTASPEAKVAVRATQLLAGLRATIPSVKQIVCQPTVPQPCITPAEADQVFVVLGKAGEYGEQLAAVLTAVDTAKTAAEAETGFAKARTLLTSISTSLQTASTLPGSADARAKVVAILGSVTALLFAVQGL